MASEQDANRAIREQQIRMDELLQGADINISFLTNMDDAKIRVSGDLHDRIMRAQKENREDQSLPAYDFPPELTSAARLGKLAAHGVNWSVNSESCAFIRALDEQRANGKGIYGGGYLLSRRAAAEKAAAEKRALGD